MHQLMRKLLRRQKMMYWKFMKGKTYRKLRQTYGKRKTYGKFLLLLATKKIRSRLKGVLLEQMR